MTTATTTKPLIGMLTFPHIHALSCAEVLAQDQNATFAGVADSFGGRGYSVAHLCRVRSFPTERELLESGLDGVIVTSETIHHRKFVQAAAEAGVKAILCESPLATTLEDGRAMVDACEKRGVRLAMAFPCRYSPALLRLREQVRSGAVGEVLAIRGTNHGVVPGGWFIDPSLSGGGAVLDRTVHVADLNRWILGKEATEVYAEIGNGFNHKDWEDTGFLTIRYGAGVFATLDTSWSRPKNYPTWGDVTLQVVGTGGVLDLDMYSQGLAHYSVRDSRISWPHWGSNVYAGLISDFLNVVAGGTSPNLATGEDGLRALDVAMAAYRSAGLQSPVSVNRV
jgi:predicted dehydrogenase